MTDQQPHDKRRKKGRVEGQRPQPTHVAPKGETQGPSELTDAGIVGPEISDEQWRAYTQFVLERGKGRQRSQGRQKGPVEQAVTIRARILDFLRDFVVRSAPGLSPDELSVDAADEVWRQVRAFIAAEWGEEIDHLVETIMRAGSGMNEADFLMGATVPYFAFGAKDKIPGAFIFGPMVGDSVFNPPDKPAQP